MRRAVMDWWLCLSAYMVFSTALTTLGAIPSTVWHGITVLTWFGTIETFALAILWVVAWHAVVKLLARSRA